MYRMIAVLEMHHLGLLDFRTFQAKNIKFDGRKLHELSLIHCLPTLSTPSLRSQISIDKRFLSRSDHLLPGRLTDLVETRSRDIADHDAALNKENTHHHKVHPPL